MLSREYLKHTLELQSACKLSFWNAMLTSIFYNFSENEGDAFVLSIVKKDPLTAMDLFRRKILKPELPRQIIPCKL